MGVKTSQHSNGLLLSTTVLGKEVVMVKVYRSLDQCSFIISEFSTCSKKAYDYMTPQVLYYTKITEKT